MLVRNYSLSHVGDQVLLRQLASLVAQDRTTTAEILAHIEALPMSPCNDQLAPAQVGVHEVGALTGSTCQHAPGRVEASGAVCVMALSCQLAPAQVASPAPGANMTPIALQRFALHL